MLEDCRSKPLLCVPWWTSTSHYPSDWTSASTTQGLPLQPPAHPLLTPIALPSLRCKDSVCLPCVSLFLKVLHWCPLSTYMGITSGANPSLSNRMRIPEMALAVSMFNKTPCFTNRWWDPWGQGLASSSPASVPGIKPLLSKNLGRWIDG